jgi:hypothetical protein
MYTHDPTGVSLREPPLLGERECLIGKSLKLRNTSFPRPPGG